MTATAAPPFEQEKFDAALGRFLGDVGAVMTGALVVAGDRLGLYRALRDGGPQTSSERPRRTKTHERYLREWLSNQTAAGYLQYDPETQRFTLPAEHVPFLADDASEVMVCGLLAAAQTMFVDEPTISEAFRTGKGVGWHEHDPRLFACTERIFRPGYAAHLLKDWIPALDGVEAKLRTGARVADLGCGLGHLDDPDGEGLPNVSFRRLRLSRGVDRSGAQGRARRRRRRQRRVRNGVGCLVYRQGFRSRLLL